MRGGTKTTLKAIHHRLNLVAGYTIIHQETNSSKFYCVAVEFSAFNYMQACPEKVSSGAMNNYGLAL